MRYFITSSPDSANSTPPRPPSFELHLDLDKNSATGLVFIDYKKASDLIDHGFLPTKLNEDADNT